MNQSTGYGPSMATGRWNRLCFDGDERKYEQWEMKFLGYMKLRKLKETILLPDHEDEPEDFYSKNEEAFAELIQFLDDRSLSLVMRDAVDDGREALKILRSHYAGTGKPRIIALYTELTSLSKGSDETITDYIIKAETVATALRNAEEEVQDSLLVAMVLKGLPDAYKSFVAVITQRDDTITFQEFKVLLRDYGETERTRKSDDSIMRASFDKNNRKCYSCGQMGHYARECKSQNNNAYKNGPNPGTRPKMWCSVCKMSNHTDKMCRRKKRENKDSSRYVNTGSSNGTDEHSFAFKLSTENFTKKNDSLLVDTGATAHILNNESSFVCYDSTFDRSNHFIELADGTRTNSVALKRGDAVVYLKDSNGRKTEVTLKNALYIPSYPHNIFSVKTATEKGATVVFGPNRSEMTAMNGVKFNIVQHGKLYFFESDDSDVSYVNKVCDLETWHKILGHCNVSDILKLEKIADGISINKGSTEKFNCEECAMGKLSQTISREPRERCTKILEMIHTDLAGPIKPIAREGFQYAISFTDDYSGIVFIYFLKHKNQATKAFEKFLADCAPHGKVKCLRSDMGTEFTCSEFQDVLSKNQIKHETSAPYSAHQNGTAERNWRTLFEMARCLLLEAKLPKSLWTYAVMASAFIRNRCYSQRLQQTPFYLFTGKKPNLKNMHIFGVQCYAYENVSKQKLDSRARKGIFVGYDRNSPAYMVYHPDMGNVKKYRCVKFAEASTERSVAKLPVHRFDDDNDDDIVVHEDSKYDDIPTVNLQGNEVQERPTRQRNIPKRYEDYVMSNDVDASLNCNVDYCYKMVCGVPKTFEEAMSGDDAQQWQDAMQNEIISLKENDSYNITELPEGRKSVGGRWVYALKDGPEGHVRYKARYVAKGYNQIEGVDYYETFSPTAKMTSLRVMVQLAAQYNLTIHQLDVKTAYLNAPIDCEIYVDQPKGFQVGKSDKNLVWKLNKSLYGLKQSGRNWNVILHDFLVQNGCTQSLADTCIYTRNSRDSRVVLLVWVDDILIAASTESLLVEMKDMLKRRFNMTDLNGLLWFLGIQFKYSYGKITMDQSYYLKKVLLKYDMESCKPRSTPSEQKLCFSSGLEIRDVTKYREMVGSLIYAMVCTRPDLCWVVTKLSQFLDRPTIEHHTAMKHVLRYIKGTLEQGLCFQRSDEKLKLAGFADADWGTSEDRKSTTGYCFMLGNNLISWKSKKQPTVALSSCEAEYMALTAATQEALFLFNVLHDMHGECIQEKITVYGDNQGAIALTKNPVGHQRSKHIDIKYHFIRTHVQNGKIDLVYVPSDQNVADVFTKPVTRAKLISFAEILFGQSM